jgi:predicted HicB family RNase H-like nuclease
MTNINISIPEQLHKKMKLNAIKADITLKDYIIKKLEEKSRKQK